MKQKLKKFFKWLWHELKDPLNLIIFIIVNVVVSASVWVPLLFAFITGDSYWYGIAAAVEVVWLGPVPYIPICLAITLGIRAVIELIRKKIRGADKNDRK